MKEINVNPLEAFNSGWALVTAGTKDGFNSMTVSWGSMGTIWGKPSVTVYIRPSRYTWQFIEKSDTFTVSFYPDSCRGALSIMGTISGRDQDKPEAAGLTPKFLESGVSYEEASVTLVCRKMYVDQLKAEALPEEAKEFYPGGGDLHYVVLGEVTDIQ